VIHVAPCVLKSVINRCSKGVREEERMRGIQRIFILKLFENAHLKDYERMGK
jgi:hypothetical protein